MAVTTYLLGAGASANAIPIVEKFDNDLGFLANLLTTIEINYPRSEKFSIQTHEYFTYDILRELINDTKWLHTNSKEHSSVDTFAKKLFLTNDKVGLNKLKAVLNFYFSLKQDKHSIDKRYDNFLASILMKDIHEFPRKVRILSWNYDSQFELAYHRFSGKDDLGDAKRRLNIITGSERNISNDVNRFSIIKLNGTAGLTDHTSKFTHFGHVNKGFNLTEFNRAQFLQSLKNYTILIRPEIFDFRSSLEFAWEKETSNNPFFEFIKQSVINTQSLVIIGYSFPFFNRTIDKYLLQECMPQLTKVYIQSKEANNIKDRFSAIFPLHTDRFSLLNVDDKQFAFANELEL